MSKPEWGAKRTCSKCNTRFYDMLRQPITCPKCASVFEAENFTKKRRGRPSVPETKAPPLPAEIDESLDLELAEELSTLNESDEVLEDTSDFGEDEKVVGIEKPSEEV